MKSALYDFNHDKKKAIGLHADCMEDTSFYITEKKQVDIVEAAKTASYSKILVQFWPRDFFLFL